MAPIVGRFESYRGGRDGAIAQLGERVVRNDEVGGSIPPGSTTLRPSGYAGHHACPPATRGGARRDRTADLVNAIHALSQLSYGPDLPLRLSSDAP